MMKHASRNASLPLMAACWSMALGVHDASATITTVAEFPIFFSSSGRIEIQAQLIGYSATDPIARGSFGGGGFPFLVRDASWDFWLGFSRNDGAGGGGLIGFVNGNNTTAYSGATGSFTSSYTYGDILGNQQSLDAWHTYELIWNTAGIPGLSGHTAAVYLDGQLNSYFFRDDFNGSFNSGSGTFAIGYPAIQGVDPRDIAFDQIRIWNNSDPALASLVLANSFEDKDLISSVGPNGAYVTGTFIEGYVGNALSTLPSAAPEPATLQLFAAAFVAFAFFSRPGVKTNSTDNPRNGSYNA